MKPFVLLRIVACVLSLIGSSAFSAQTIYGLETAKHFKSHAKKDFYIQVGSYKIKSNAIRMVASLKNKTTAPVTLKTKQHNYAVIIGPLHSALAVRQALKHPNNYVKKPTVSTKTLVSLKDKDILPNNWFIGAGVAWINPYATNFTSFATSGMPLFPDDKYVANHAKDATQYSVLAGYQWQRPTDWLPFYNVSLGYSYIDSHAIQGVIFENNLADSKNFTFQYKISQHIPMLKFKADLYRWTLMPYVSAGAGLAINQVRGYSDSPIPGATVQHRRFGFNSATNTQFAGSIGAGFDYLFNFRTQLSLGYELSYYGNMKTGFGQGVLAPYRLGNQMNSNAVVFQATHFFE